MGNFLRRGRESNPRMAVLQTAALPLRHHALVYKQILPIQILLMQNLVLLDLRACLPAGRLPLRPLTLKISVRG